MICRHLQCDRDVYARTVCYHHYQELRNWKAKPVETVRVEELARSGTNRSCVDCGDAPLFGGMRCHDCFLSRVESRRGTVEHVFPGRAATVATYVAGCRCWECRKASADNRKRYRKAKR